jgi:hypothetical protein
LEEEWRKNNIMLFELKNKENEIQVDTLEVAVKFSRGQWFWGSRLEASTT